MYEDATDDQRQRLAVYYLFISQENMLYGITLRTRPLSLAHHSLAHIKPLSKHYIDII